MTTGNCPQCGMRATLFKCDVCGEVRCNSSTRSGGNTGCSVAGKGANAGHKCKSCNRGKYKNL